MTENDQPYHRDRATTGVQGLDEILHGGLPDNRSYLIEGGPGTGKTTLALQFLLEGARQDESGLFISLLQSRDEVNDTATSHGWSLDNLHFVELPEDVQQYTDTEQTVFDPAEVELDEVTTAIIDAIRRHRPRRFVLDSLSELNAIVQNDYQLRRQLVKIKRSLLGLDQPCTALFTSNRAVVEHQPTVHTIMHGSIRLLMDSKTSGEPRRRLVVEKVRGIDFDGGCHDMDIRAGGVIAYPTLPVAEPVDQRTETLASGNSELDALFGGGLDRGSACLVMGTSGAGKSTLISCYAAAAADAGHFASVYCFDEGRQTYLRRSRGLKLGVDEHINAGRIALRQPVMGSLSPGKLLAEVRRDVIERNAKLVVFDSYTGWQQMMAGQEQLDRRLHEMLRFLTSHNVLTLVTFNLPGTFGSLIQEQGIDASYLADTVVLMRHFEAMGYVRRCISVLKQRHGEHERTIREIEFGEGGLRVGPPLAEFSGVLTGSPHYRGRKRDLLGEDSNDVDE